MDKILWCWLSSHTYLNLPHSAVGGPAVGGYRRPLGGGAAGLHAVLSGQSTFWPIVSNQSSQSVVYMHTEGLCRSDVTYDAHILAVLNVRASNASFYDCFMSFLIPSQNLFFNMNLRPGHIRELRADEKAIKNVQMVTMRNGMKEVFRMSFIMLSGSKTVLKHNSTVT